MRWWEEVTHFRELNNVGCCQHCPVQSACPDLQPQTTAVILPSIILSFGWCVITKCEVGAAWLLLLICKRELIGFTETVRLGLSLLLTKSASFSAYLSPASLQQKILCLICQFTSKLSAHKMSFSEAWSSNSQTEHYTCWCPLQCFLNHQYENY